MRVLTICDVLFPHTVGGAGRVARELASALERRGVEIEFLTRQVHSSHPERIRTEYLPPLWQAPLGAFRRTFRRQARRFRPDIIHTHQPLPAYFAVPADSRTPMVYTFHSSWPEELKIKSSKWPASLRAPISSLYSGIERSVLAAASAVIVLSDYSRQQVRQAYGRDATIIHGGVDTVRFQPAAVERNGNEVQLITVRNLVPRMGLDSLIRAMALLPSHVRLNIGGEGPLKANLETLVRDLQLTGRVRLLGHVPDADLPRFYSSGDWFVLPTAALEGFGLVTLESLACGTPVLGTRIGAIPEVLNRFDSNWVIDSPDPKSIAKTVRRALESRPPARGDLHAQVAREFSWDRIAGSYAALFERLIRKQA